MFQCIIMVNKHLSILLQFDFYYNSEIEQNQQTKTPASPIARTARATNLATAAAVNHHHTSCPRSRRKVRPGGPRSPKDAGGEALTQPTA